MFKRGELVLIPYPFTNLVTRKRRPALVLTVPDKYGDFTALPVTSRDYHLNSIPLMGELDAGILPKDSWVRTDRIITLNQSLVVKSVAVCSQSIIDKVINKLCSHLGRENE